MVLHAPSTAGKIVKDETPLRSERFSDYEKNPIFADEEKTRHPITRLFESVQEQTPELLLRYQYHHDLRESIQRTLTKERPLEDQELLNRFLLLTTSGPEALRDWDHDRLFGKELETGTKNDTLELLGLAYVATRLLEHDRLLLTNLLDYQIHRKRDETEIFRRLNLFYDRLAQNSESSFSTLVAREKHDENTLAETLCLKGMLSLYLEFPRTRPQPPNSLEAWSESLREVPVQYRDLSNDRLSAAEVKFIESIARRTRVEEDKKVELRPNQERSSHWTIVTTDHPGLSNHELWSLARDGSNRSISKISKMLRAHQSTVFSAYKRQVLLARDLLRERNVDGGELELTTALTDRGVPWKEYTQITPGTESSKERLRENEHLRNLIDRADRAAGEIRHLLNGWQDIDSSWLRNTVGRVFSGDPQTEALAQVPEIRRVLSIAGDALDACIIDKDNKNGLIKQWDYSNVQARLKDVGQQFEDSFLTYYKGDGKIDSYQHRRLWSTFSRLEYELKKLRKQALALI